MAGKLSIIDFLEVYPGDVLLEYSLSAEYHFEQECVLREIKYIKKREDSFSRESKAIITVSESKFCRADINKARQLFLNEPRIHNVFLCCFFERSQNSILKSMVQRIRLIKFLLKMSCTMTSVNVFAVKDNLFFGAPLFSRYPKKILSCASFLAIRFWINEMIFVLHAVLLEKKISIVVKCR